MSLMKKRSMTEKRLAALARNRQNARGPATPEGRRRIRDANLRHGFYSQSDEAVLRALGDNPDDFRALLEGLRGKDTASETLRDHLADRVARTFLRMRRVDRMIDGFALRQAKQEDFGREGRLHMQMMRLKLTSRNWQLLAEAVARPRYVTRPEDLERMQNLHKEGIAKEMSEVAVALFYELGPPGEPKPGEPGFVDAEENEKRRVVMNKIRGIFGLKPVPVPGKEWVEEEGRYEPVPAGQQQAEGSGTGAAPLDVDSANSESPAPDASPVEDNPYPEVTEEEWEAREPVRQLLENILTRQVQAFDAQHHALMVECLKGPSPEERAAEIVPAHPNTELIQRMEAANFRQISQMTSLLLRLKREERLGDKSKRSDVSTEV